MQGLGFILMGGCGCAGLLKSESDKGAGLTALVRHAGGDVQKSLPQGLKGSKAAVAWLFLATPGDKKWATSSATPGLQFHSRSVLTDHAMLRQKLDRSTGILFST
jgi:hypothetical protein